jgi:hypothetical protein
VVTLSASHRERGIANTNSTGHLSFGFHHRSPVAMMMEAVRTSETSVDKHFTRQYNPENSSEQQNK